MADTPVRLDMPHTPGCNNQLIIIGADYLMRHRGLQDVVKRDAIGRRHKHAWRNWIVLICNTIGCDAVVLVRADAIEELATQALKVVGNA